MKTLIYHNNSMSFLHKTYKTKISSMIDAQVALLKCTWCSSGFDPYEGQTESCYKIKN